MYILWITKKKRSLRCFYIHYVCKHIISRPCTFFRLRKGKGPKVDLHPPCDVSTSFHVHVHSLDYENIRSPRWTSIHHVCIHHFTSMYIIQITKRKGAQGGLLSTMNSIQQTGFKWPIKRRFIAPRTLCLFPRLMQSNWLSPPHKTLCKKGIEGMYACFCFLLLFLNIH